jgi:hypothetical protein
MVVSHTPQLITVKTDFNGIAKINIALGADISANSTRVGTVRRIRSRSARISSRSTLSPVCQPITAFAFPDVADHLEITGGANTGPILTWADTCVSPGRCLIVE